MDRTLVLRFDARILVLVGALLASVAVSLPWANLPSFLAGDLARQGIEGGGLLTLGLAVLAAFSLLLPWHPWRRVSLPAAFWAALIDLVALAALVKVIQLSVTVKMSLGAQLSSVGSGLYLTFAGVLLMLIGGLAGVTSPAPQHAASANPPLPWLGYVGWVALVMMLLSSCLCAWGIGWLARPETVGGPGKTLASPTFAPAPTTYLATPLVDVYLMPLGTVPTITLSLPLTRSATPLPTAPAALTASPTPRRSTPTGLLSPTLPVISASTFTPTPWPTPPTSPLPTPTVTIPVAAVPTTAVPVVPTPTATVSATPTLTETVSATPTLTATVSATPTLTATATITLTVPVTP